MNSYIRNLQSKPVEVRKQMLVASLVVSMAFVGVVWVYGLTERFGNNSEDVATEKKDNSLAPFKVFANSISNAYTNISASVGQISSKENTAVDTPKTEQKQIELIPVEPSSQ
jgi:hypothetical protein